MSTTNSTITSTEEPATKRAKTSENSTAEAEAERVSKALRERLEEHDNNRKEVQEMLHMLCEVWRKEIDDLEERINNELREVHKRK